MSSLTTHVGEQPDVLSADADCMKQVAETVKELKAFMSPILYMMHIMQGNRNDALTLFACAGKFMFLLHRLKERQRAAAEAIDKYRNDWEHAVIHRTGKLGRLVDECKVLKQSIRDNDHRLHDLKNDQLQTESRLTSLKQQEADAETALQGTQASEASINEAQNAERRRLQAKEASINEAHDTERRQLRDLEASINLVHETQQRRLRDLETDLARREDIMATWEVEHVDRESEHEAKVRAFDAEERKKIEELSQREKELTKREMDFEHSRISQEKDLTARISDLNTYMQEIENREDAAGNPETTLQREEERVDTANQNLQGAMSIERGLADLTGHRDIVANQSGAELEGLIAPLQSSAGRPSLKRRHDQIDIGRVQDLEGQLSQLQGNIVTMKSETTRLRTELNDRVEDLHSLSAANDANVLALRGIQDVHAACESGKRLQLGCIDRRTFFEEFSKHAKKPSDNGVEHGMVWRGQESGHDVDLCFYVLSESSETLCLIRRPGEAFTIWHSKREDCSTFFYGWRRWVCLGRRGQGKPIYIRLTVEEQLEAWLERNLIDRTVGNWELDDLHWT